MQQACIMIVEDEYIVAIDLQERLENLGYTVSVLAHSGEDAMSCIDDMTADIILMDIVLNGKYDGIETSLKIRDKHSIPIIFITAHASKVILERAKLTEPFGYIIKPFKDRELRAVIEMALYKAKMEEELQKSNQKLQKALAEVDTLGELLPICANCKKIRDDEGYWHQVEMYIQNHSNTKFSHSICPECAESLYPELTTKSYEDLKKED